MIEYERNKSAESCQCKNQQFETRNHQKPLSEKTAEITKKRVRFLITKMPARTSAFRPAMRGSVTVTRSGNQGQAAGKIMSDAAKAGRCSAMQSLLDELGMDREAGSQWTTESME